MIHFPMFLPVCPKEFALPDWHLAVRVSQSASVYYGWRAASPRRQAKTTRCPGMPSATRPHIVLLH